MFRTIVVPLDGSESSEQAVSVAARIARSAGAELHLVHVLELYTLARNTGMAPPTLAFGQQALQVARRYLAGVAERLAPGVNVSYEVLPETVIESLLDYVERIDADLLVMTPHSRQPEHRLWLASTAYLLARACSCPILLVNQSERATLGDFRHVLVPVDGSAASETAIPVACALASLTDAPLTLMTVSNPDHAPVPAASMAFAPGSSWAGVEAQDCRQVAAEYLAAVAERASFAGLEPCTATVVTRGSVAHQIIAYGRAHEADVIVMSTRGEAGCASRTALGRISDQVARMADVPVLLCPA
jgi:nucleotide-binding universal stress UspA family protein